MNFGQLIKKFNFHPTLEESCKTGQDMLIQVYLNKFQQSVEISYAYEDDYFSLELKHQSGNSITGSFEDMLNEETWSELFNKNKVNV